MAFWRTHWKVKWLENQQQEGSDWTQWLSWKRKVRGTWWEGLKTGKSGRNLRELEIICLLLSRLLRVCSIIVCVYLLLLHLVGLLDHCQTQVNVENGRNVCLSTLSGPFLHCWGSLRLWQVSGSCTVPLSWHAPVCYLLSATQWFLSATTTQLVGGVWTCHGSFSSRARSISAALPGFRPRCA